MLRGLFVTGIDTHVGKTVVAVALLRRYRRQLPLRYWKPIQTGTGQDDDTAEVGRLAGAGSDEMLNAGIRLPHAVSPHLAARRSGTVIDLEALIDSFRHNSHSACWVVEGAGGVLVPINDSDAMADLMTRLGLVQVVVARTALGTINHTLLTLEALRHRSLPVAGVVMVGHPDADNRAAIERYGQTFVLGEMPHFDRLTPDRLAAWAARDLDPEGRLLELLQ